MRDIFYKVIAVLLHLAGLSYGQHCELLGGNFTCQEIQQEAFLSEISKVAATLPHRHIVSTIDIRNSHFPRIDFFPNPGKFVSQFRVNTLIIKNSNITHIEADAFREYTTLEKLILCDNKIENTAFIKVLKNERTSIDLSRNNIRILDLNNFNNYYDYSYHFYDVYLRENNMDIIKPAAHEQQFNHMDLSYNNIQEFNETHLNSFFSSLDIKYNNLSTLSLNHYDHGHGNSKKYVNIMMNDISSLSEYNKIFRCDELHSTSLINNTLYIRNHLSLRNSNIGILNRTVWDISKIHNSYEYGISLSLDLSNASISNISQYYFDNVQFRMLNLSHNNISFLHHRIFRNSFITYLDLSFSGIRNMSGNSFEGLSDCYYLNLTGNHLETIQGICEYAKFRHINLSSNKFQTIGNDYLIDCVKLQTLDFSYNSINHLKPFSFVNSVSIRKIDLSHNDLNILESNVFYNLSVVSLKLSNSNIYYIASKAFNNLYNLDLLDLSSSGITNIEKDAFFNLPKIKSIILNDNNLIVIHSHTFRNMRGLSLNLSGNRIESLNASAFENLNLTSLDLRSNSLSEIRNNTFKNSIIREMLLQDNNVSAPISFDSTVNVTSLSVNLNGVLEKRSISSVYLEKLHLVDSSFVLLKSDCFIGLPYLKVLNFDKSRIGSFESGALHGLYSLEHLDSSTLLLNQRILDNGTFSELHKLKILQIDSPTLSRLEQESLSGLMNLEVLNITCTQIHTLPPNIFDDLKNLRILDLSRNSLETLDSNNFKNLVKLTGLFLQHNQLSQLPLGLFNNLNELDVMRLDQNRLEILDPGVFNGLFSLRSLNISHNTNLFPLYSDYNRISVADSAIALRTLRTLVTLNVDFTFRNEGITALPYIYSTLSTSFPNLRSIGINNNWIPCDVLMKMLEYYTSKGIDYTPESPRYNTTNLEGIVCKSIRSKHGIGNRY